MAYSASLETEDSVAAGLPELLPRLWRFSLTLTGDRSQADDLVQAACVRALERAHQFQAGSRLDSWMYAIITSVWKNGMRANTVRRGAGLVDVSETPLPDGSPPPELSYHARQVLAQIDALPEGQRSVVLLVCVEGFTYEEAARALAIPAGTVMSRLSAARKSLGRLNAA